MLLKGWKRFITKLLGIREIVLNPIMHFDQVPTASEESHVYYVFDGATRYEYVLSEENHSAEKGMPTKTS